ncbi:hypothetical protein H5410_061366 [Solanum commersonii]|uniref:Uncharacterized protein n=1 Tax=Solanum commersonii TaxID=4109 RepID=A0A9J5W8Y1_SOLCO|nr:hypothetical protein H5410_061366 [Solanum commersonii]
MHLGTLILSKYTPKLDPSAKLVGITKTFGDPPFVGIADTLAICLLVDFITFLLLPLAFSHFEALGNRSNASQNCSMTCRLLLFIAELTFSFRAQHTVIKGDLQVDRRLANRGRRSSSLHFFVLFIRLVPSCQVVFLGSLYLLQMQVQAQQRNLKQVFIMFENLCCGGPFVAISQDHRYARRSTFWSILSPSCFCLQHSRILRHWVIEHTGTKGDLQADWRLANRARRSLSLYFFVLFIRLIPSCHIDLHQILRQNMHLRTLILSKYNPK